MNDVSLLIRSIEMSISSIYSTCVPRNQLPMGLVDIVVHQQHKIPLDCVLSTFGAQKWVKNTGFTQKTCVMEEDWKGP